MEVFLCLVSFGLPMVNFNNLFVHSDFNMVYPNVISIGILSFGAQNVVPTLLEYLNYDTIKTRQAILVGSLIPLVLYTIWEGVFLGLIDLSNANESSKLEVVSVLGKTGGPIVNDLVKLFSLCAICSSMAGAIDFFQDAISKLSSKNESEGGSVEESMSSVSKTRVLAAFLALAPPVLLAYSYPDIFLVASSYINSDLYLCNIHTNSKSRFVSHLSFVSHIVSHLSLVSHIVSNHMNPYKCYLIGVALIRLAIRIMYKLDITWFFTCSLERTHLIPFMLRHLLLLLGGPTIGRVATIVLDRRIPLATSSTWLIG